MFKLKLIFALLCSSSMRACWQSNCFPSLGLCFPQASCPNRRIDEKPDTVELTKPNTIKESEKNWKRMSRMIISQYTPSISYTEEEIEEIKQEIENLSKMKTYEKIIYLNERSFYNLEDIYRFRTNFALDLIGECFKHLNPSLPRDRRYLDSFDTISDEKTDKMNFIRNFQYFALYLSFDLNKSFRDHKIDKGAAALSYLMKKGHFNLHTFVFFCVFQNPIPTIHPDIMSRIPIENFYKLCFDYMSTEIIKFKIYSTIEASEDVNFMRIRSYLGSYDRVDGYTFCSFIRLLNREDRKVLVEKMFERFDSEKRALLFFCLYIEPDITTLSEYIRDLTKEKSDLIIEAVSKHKELVEKMFGNLEYFKNDDIHLRKRTYLKDGICKALGYNYVIADNVYIIDGAIDEILRLKWTVLNNGYRKSCLYSGRIIEEKIF